MAAAAAVDIDAFVAQNLLWDQLPPSAQKVGRVFLYALVVGVRGCRWQQAAPEAASHRAGDTSIVSLSVSESLCHPNIALSG